MPYFLWRISYIAIKPLAILFAAKFLNADSASLIALAIAISGSLMASLSFGTYRFLFQARSQSLRLQRADLMRKSTFLFNIIILCLFGSIAALIFGHETVAFVTAFVITEHVVHDESRVLLYAGSRERWARENCLRTLFVLAVPVLTYIGGDHVSLLAAMLIATFVNVVISTARGGLFRLRHQTIFVLVRPSFYRMYRRQFNYFVSGTLNRINQQSDRYIFSVMSFETLWIYSLVAQIGNLPLMFFEMSHLSRLKETVAQQKAHSFQWIPRRQLLTLAAVSIFAILTYGLIGVTTRELFNTLFVTLLISTLAVNYLAATSMFNGERLFWALRDGGLFARLEISAFVACLIASVFVVASGRLPLVVLPKALNLLVRIRNSHRWLQS